MTQAGEAQPFKAQINTSLYPAQHIPTLELLTGAAFSLDRPWMVDSSIHDAQMRSRLMTNVCFKTFGALLYLIAPETESFMFCLYNLYNHHYIPFVQYVPSPLQQCLSI